MATWNLVKNISEEATCSLCLEHFKHPVMVDCGHNFCQACITQCLEKAPAGPFCPQCRQAISPGNLKPNRQLANLVELIGKLEQGKEEEDKRGVCGKHQEPLRLFCKEDRMCICMVCDRSKEHKTHNVVPLDEASEEYKGKIKKKMPFLEKKRKELEALLSYEEQKSQKFLTLLETERQKGLSAFKRLQGTLEENKRAWLSCLGDLENKMKKNKEENAEGLLNHILDLNSLIAGIEQKYQQPASEFLQDTAKRFDRYNSSEDLKLVLKPSQELESTLTVLMEKMTTLEKMVIENRDYFETMLQEGLVSPGARVTLDPDTAHPYLSISENQQKVTCVKGSQSLMVFKPKQFDTMWCVLGCEKFTAGKHYWDVEIGGNKAVWLGVARESVKRKGIMAFSPEEGICAIQYPSVSRMNLNSPTKVRVALDYEEGRVTLSDLCSGALISTFTSGSFGGETVRPFFQLPSEMTLKCL